ncbi:MAG: Flagellar export protein FliJ [Synergistales bacterium 53_16]|jgi:flagellar FliJ protein|nr:MAG: Flagellar export protein FliJ [Synergistales bacterium 53_16]MDN5335022.1 Flagellar FliJ protein [Synergistales bacterium]
MTAAKKLKRLEKLKDIRERLQDETKGRMAEARKKMETLEVRSDVLDGTWQDVLRDFREKSRGGDLTPEELWFLRNGIDSLESEMEEVGRAIRDTEEELEEIRQELRQRHVETKVVEVVLEKKKKKIRRDQEKSEQKELDDLACMVYLK